MIAEIQDGNWAQGALTSVIKKLIAYFSTIEDAYLAERAADIRDLGVRILSQLQKHQANYRDYPNATILMGEEIPASLLAEVPDGLAGGRPMAGVVNGDCLGIKQILTFVR